MGSFTRIEIYYTNLEAFLKSQKGATVYGALLEGTNIHEMRELKPSGFLIMGNESNGIHPNLFPYITHKVSIPRRGQAESLNVAIATAVLCDNILR
jgi:TrmH family RNA methyltransferase